MINTVINELLGEYTENGSFIFQNGPILQARPNLIAASIGVPNNKPGLYFIYAPYSNSIQNASFLSQRVDGLLYTLIYVGKAGMDNAGLNAGGQMLHGRINNVGAGNRPRSQIWTEFMIAKGGLPHLLFKWLVTRRQLNPPVYDNCYFIEQGFCKIWKGIPEYKPELNS